MKRSLFLFAAASLGYSLAAQQAAPQAHASAPLSPDVRSIYQSETWQRAMSGYYGVNTEVSPRPENADVQQIQQVAEMLGDPATMPAAIEQLNQYRTRTKEPNSHSPVIDQIIGAAYFQLGQLAEADAERERLFNQARTNLQTAIERFPTYRQAYKNLANLEFRQGNQSKAREHFVKALELGDRDPITYGILAAIYYENGQYSAAETAARNSIMLNPAIVEFRRILGLALFQQERYEEARAVFEELLQERPNDAFYWQMISNALINTDQIDEAAKVLEVVRFMGQSQPRTLLLLGDVYMNKNMVEDAAAAYQQALNQSRSNEEDLPSLETFQRPIESLNNFQAYDLAMELLNKVEAVYRNKMDDQQRVTLLALRSEINLAQGESEEAARNLQEILRNDPMNARALLTLANYYAYRNAPEGLSTVEEREFLSRSVQRALDLYGRAQELLHTNDSANIEAARAAFVGEGQLQARQRNLPQAIAALREAQRIREEERIAEYIEMIQQVEGSARR